MTDQSKEEQILLVMRKVLTRVVRELAPPPGMRHPLSEETIEDVRQCLGLIAAREKELAEVAGRAPQRPHFTDEPRPKVVPIDSIGRSAKETKH